MAYDEKDYLQLSGLQHFAFCRRQWALIHVENQWAENVRTVEGQYFHKRAHDARYRERRGNVLTVRGISCSSSELGVSGQCDVLELHRVDTEEASVNSEINGIPIADCEGLWVPFPVEYKKGTAKNTDADRLQLCCQGMCLEEMLCTDVPRGALFYGESRRRENVEFTHELRNRVRVALTEMHSCYERGHTPKAKPSKSCNACSLKDLCLPRITKTRTVAQYIGDALAEDRELSSGESSADSVADDINDKVTSSDNYGHNLKPDN